LGAYIISIRPEDLGIEVERMELINGSGSNINARGIEVDPRDGNYWITDLAGNIYKIANFETPSNPLSDVNDTKQQEASGIIVSPNPVVNQTVIGFMTGKVEAHVTLEVYNLIGERVAQLVNGTVSADDNHAVLFDCSTLPNGVYTIALTVDGISRPAEKFIISR
ncbi:MAG: T9SS type A sorting domain-containing protein, partial [Candidatus Kapabacteria bacterium]|nr:T9SS type A sorting domain-containing protein [Candidatus Kapabacteria bacterium]